MEEHINTEYISLFEASKLCSYSEPYLRLRARQGKLKSIKLGKKWMTTELWIKDYVKKTKEWNAKIAAKKAQVKEFEAEMKEEIKEIKEIQTSITSAKEEEIIQEIAQPVSIEEPEVLTVNENSAKQIRDKVKKKNWDEPNLIDRNPVPDFALVIGSALMFALAIFFAVSSVNSPYAPLNPPKELIGSGQATAKNGVDTVVLREFSNDLVMPQCYCQGEEISRNGAGLKDDFFTRAAQAVAETFWPW
ncbi:MAG TPA: hypothetical protein P5080_05010 [Candidatus Paceibacterota bacterium]|nr:hypothetical protein [Candidatus Pacearchaeota archaeon]HRZ51308.1 hypothetical protein [Candidatus Paceibacterota bacterium]HSA37030.1 hypothetical protein [Candidatus Paceibacterota bacterium]